MRRWVCVLVLLFGVGAGGDPWHIRLRRQIPIVRDLSSFEGDQRHLAATTAWWLPG